MKTWSQVPVVLSVCGAVLVGCAKQRPVEVLNDPEKSQLKKADFLGSDPSSSTLWLSKVTVVGTSTDGGFTFVGYQSEAKAGHFEFTEEKLRFLNDIQPHQKTGTSAAREVINEWSVQHHDVKLAVSDGAVTNREQEDDEKSWSQKRFFSIDFSKAEISEASSFPYSVGIGAARECWRKASSRLSDRSLETSPEYLSFVVAVTYEQDASCVSDLRRWNRGDFTYTVEYRYSFSKIDPAPIRPGSYQPYVYAGEADPLNSRYGYFQTMRESIDPKRGVIKNTFLMKRWDPDKEHHYFFAEDFPEEYKWIFNDPKVGIFAKTNELMAQNGLAVRFYIHENTGVNGLPKKFGDLRYSFIKIVPEMDSGAPFGYGPSDAHPLTGEILSGNVVIWTGYLKWYMERISASLDRMDSKLETSSLFSSLKNTLGGAQPSEWTATSSTLTPRTAAGKAYFELLPKRTFGFPGWSQYTSSPGRTERVSAPRLKGDGAAQFEEMTQVIERVRKSETRAAKDQSSGCVFPIHGALDAVPGILANGLDKETALMNLVYSVSMHEFGHNLGLRHNFYGSIDKRHFPEPKPLLGSDGKPVLDSKGNPLVLTQKTASVMDYLDLTDEIHAHFDWAEYDKAAVVYSLSGGAIDLGKGKDYLYCTDEHTVVNALCNHWDSGSTPSEVAMSLISRYENSYQYQNYRMGRAYWDTGFYASGRFKDMWQMKKFLMLWRSGLNEERVGEELGKAGKSSAEAKEISHEIVQDVIQANKLAIAFYNAVLQQVSSDRPWRDEFEVWSGEKKRIGILYDKLFAMHFLMGDDPLPYDPNNPLYSSSYITFRDVPELSSLIDTVFENTLTERVDMQPWFIDMGRGYYAASATNYVNRDDVTLLNRIKLTRYSESDFQKAFELGADQNRELGVVAIEKSGDAYFEPGETIGYVRIHGRLYVAHRTKNPIAFNIISKMLEADKAGSSLVTGKSDVLSLYDLYRSSSGDLTP